MSSIGANKQANNNSLRGRQAVVIGASMAGLSVGRVLSGHFGSVTLIERDRLTEGAQARKGVPVLATWHIRT
jgi:glycine/D-amino acid oxidase-like deaminating enzyme